MCMNMNDLRKVYESYKSLFQIRIDLAVMDPDPGEKLGKKLTLSIDSVVYYLSSICFTC